MEASTALILESQKRAQTIGEPGCHQLCEGADRQVHCKVVVTNRDGKMARLCFDPTGLNK